MVFCICGNAQRDDSDIPSIGKNNHLIRNELQFEPSDGQPPLQSDESTLSPTYKQIQINESTMNQTTTPGTPSPTRDRFVSGHQSGVLRNLSVDECSKINGCPSIIPFTPSSDFTKEVVSAEDSLGGGTKHTSPNLSYSDPSYIDEFGLVPEDQYNSATAVPFFSMCSATMGYPTARLLQFRLNGIMCIPESPLRRNVDFGL